MKKKRLISIDKLPAKFNKKNSKKKLIQKDLKENIILFTFIKLNQKILLIFILISFMNFISYYFIIYLMEKKLIALIK